MPEFKREQSIELTDIIRSAIMMVSDECLDRQRVEVPAAANGVFGQVIAEIFVEFVSKPAVHRDGEAMLPPIQDLRGKTSLHC